MKKVTFGFINLVKKKPKKISIKKLVEAVNNESFTKKFFLNEKEAKEHIKND